MLSSRHSSPMASNEMPELAIESAQWKRLCNIRYKSRLQRIQETTGTSENESKININSHLHVQDIASLLT